MALLQIWHGICLVNVIWRDRLFVVGPTVSLPQEWKKSKLQKLSRWRDRRSVVSVSWDNDCQLRSQLDRLITTVDHTWELNNIYNTISILGCVNGWERLDVPTNTIRQEASLWSSQWDRQTQNITEKTRRKIKTERNQTSHIKKHINHYKDSWDEREDSQSLV